MLMDSIILTTGRESKDVLCKKKTVYTYITSLYLSSSCKAGRRLPILSDGGGGDGRPTTSSTRYKLALSTETLLTSMCP
jgi:hypothetical protein